MKGLKFSYNGPRRWPGRTLSSWKGLSRDRRSQRVRQIHPPALISGFLEPSGGAELLGRNVRAYPKAELARLIAYVPSELYLPYDLSVFEIALMGRSPHVAWWRDYCVCDAARVLEVLKQVGIAALRDRSINSLSSGERQLAFIAQALAQDPKVLLLDEPTSHLDINYKIQIFELLTRLASAAMAIMVVSHDLALLSAYAGKALMLKKGGQLFYGPAAEGLSGANIAAAYGISDPASVARLIGGRC